VGAHRNLSFALLACAALAAAGCPACEDICRNDLDCNTDDEKWKCVQNVCTTAFPAQPADACEGDDDCTAVDDHLRCVDGACAFAPACQFVADGTALTALARRGTAVGTVAVAAARTGTGCAFDLVLPGADGGTTAIDIDEVDARTGAVTTADCGAGRWTSAGPGGWLSACGGVDYVIARPGTALCFTDDGACAGGLQCAVMNGFGADDLAGVCE
jgi:hypothetical protein